MNTDLINMGDEPLAELAALAFRLGLEQARTLAIPDSPEHVITQVVPRPWVGVNMVHIMKLWSCYRAGWEISRTNDRLKAKP